MKLLYKQYNTFLKKKYRTLRQTSNSFIPLKKLIEINYTYTERYKIKDYLKKNGVNFGKFETLCFSHLVFSSV